jgi:hypothetical protein
MLSHAHKDKGKDEDHGRMSAMHFPKLFQNDESILEPPTAFEGPTNANTTAFQEKILKVLEAKMNQEEDNKAENHESIIGENFLAYEKKLSPQPVCKPPNVECDLNVTGVYRIDEKEQNFNISFDVTFTWFDPSIPFYHAEEKGGNPIDFTKHFIPEIRGGIQFGPCFVA